MSAAAKPLSTDALADQTSTHRAAYWELAQRIASSEIFARSEFLPKFLLYICDRQLSGRTHEITEQQIGERVFGRPAGYSPGEDNIVRNYAGQLRKRLEVYYERVGKGMLFVSASRAAAMFRYFSRGTPSASPRRPTQGR
jgi:hypothetical protein